MAKGYFSLILHAHLPFVRHPEYPEFLEEDWLFEAITEVYIPLIFIFERLHQAGAEPRLAMNISPPLCEMLADPLLQERYTNHLKNLVALSKKEQTRVATEDPEFQDVVDMYVRDLEDALALWNDRYERNLIGAFRDLQNRGVLEIITCCATHGFLPLISTHESRRAQIEIAVTNYRKHFQRNPRGIWLAECAYEPGVEDLLKDSGIEYFVGDSHAILYGDPRPRYGVHAPIRCPNGVAVFARDVETSQQVWSAEAGYPGHPEYREFYRDIGWDLPIDYLKPHLHSDGNRRHLGLKYFRITGKDTPQNKKRPYSPARATQLAADHATDFLHKRIRQAEKLRSMFGGHPPLVTSPYDAELYGHWWFEGPQFIDYLFRQIHFDQDDIAAVTPGDFLDSNIPIQIQEPSASSWGENGYYKVWLNEGTAWMYEYAHEAERRMTQLANGFDSPNETERRILNQCARELLLAQSSDWAFQIYQGTTVEYSSKRFRSHIHRFTILSEALENGSIDEELLQEIESRDTIFQEVDYRAYRTR
ncbi:MAG: 1,4-alpha-glucan branching protein domain-containing protein [Pyrinomonadaceae bacterium]